MATLLAPVARRNWNDAAWAGAFSGACAWAGSLALAIKARGLSVGFFVAVRAYPEFAKLGLADQVTLALPVVAGLACASWALYVVAGTKQRTEVQGEGGQLRQGAAAAGAELKREAKLSEVLFSVAGIKFTIDRVRRSFVILGSIGGGKTQVIWNLLRGLHNADFRILLVDGPKGDFSTCYPNGLLRIAPWHNGPSWDIATDCPTRNHARELARSLIPISEKDPIWGNAAGMVFVAVLCKLQTTKGTAWSWGDIYDNITLPIESLHAIAAEFYPPAAQALADAQSKTTQSIVINLTAFMADVFELSLAWKNTKERFSFCDWWRGGQGQQVVILQGSGEFRTLAGGYISSIINTLANLTASPSFSESKTRKNIIVIDEMAQLPRIAGVEKFLEIGRSKGCSAIFATQSPAQLRKIYGHDDLSSIMAMVGTKAFVRISGADDQQVALKELGEREIYLPTTSQTSQAGAAAGQSITAGWSREKVEVVRADQLKALGPTDRGIDAIADGIGKDPIQVCFPYYKAEVRRPPYLPNPNFNQNIRIVQADKQSHEDAAANAETVDQAVHHGPAPDVFDPGLSDDEIGSAMGPDEITMISPGFINADSDQARQDAEPAEEIEAKILDVASDPIANAILGHLGADLLQLVREVQEVSADAVSDTPPSTAVLQKMKFRRRTPSPPEQVAI